SEPEWRDPGPAQYQGQTRQNRQRPPKEQGRSHGVSSRPQDPPVGRRVDGQGNVGGLPVQGHAGSFRQQAYALRLLPNHGYFLHAGTQGYVYDSFTLPRRLLLRIDGQTFQARSGRESHVGYVALSRADAQVQPDRAFAPPGRYGEDGLFDGFDGAGGGLGFRYPDGKGVPGQRTP